MKHTAEKLKALVRTEQFIHCSNCRHHDYMITENKEHASEVFFQGGWRSTEKNTYCPNCAKKKLKQQ